MKLWHVAQWGNKDEGGNGPDTQCIVRADDMMKAIEIAEAHLAWWQFKGGQTDVVFLLGDDGVTNGEPMVVIRGWIDNALNMGNYPSWHRDLDTGEWIDHITMFGDNL